MQLILELFSAIAFALWTGRLGLRSEIDITWKRPWPVLRYNSDSAFTSWRKPGKISHSSGDLRSIVNLNVLERCCSGWPCKVAGMLEPSVPLRKSTPRCVRVRLERVVPKTDTPVFVNDAAQSIHHHEAGCRNWTSSDRCSSQNTKEKRIWIDRRSAPKKMLLNRWRRKGWN